MKDVYCISLSGGGDTYIYFVDEESWRWITSPPPKGLRTAGHLPDTQCPPTQLKLMKLEDPDMEDFPDITIGSYENDRALACRPTEGDTFYSVAVAIKYATKHNLNIVDDYQGYIY